MPCLGTGQCLIDVFFNRQSAQLLVQTVLLFSPTCFLIRLRQTSYRGFTRQTERTQHDPLISRSVIDDVLSLDTSTFGDFVDGIYPIELKIKDTTDTARSASHLDLHLQSDSECR